MTDIDATNFAAEVAEAGEQLPPGRAGLLLARECAYPDMRPSDHVVVLDDLATAAHAALAGQRAPLDRGLALAEFLFQAAGFVGNRQDYGDPRNSYLNQVLERRLGIPISLSVIFIEVGARLRLPVRGVGLPGHFVAQVEGDDGPVYVDPFNGGRVVSVEDCAELVRASAGLTGVFDRQWLAPASTREIVVRMLNNLRNHYLQVENWSKAICIAERLHILQPASTRHLRDLGILHYRNGSYRKASQLLSEYVAREPDAPDADSVRQGRDLLLAELSRLN
jgi:regulator of sirC expression with transglutaminase-like and TPR domain